MGATFHRQNNRQVEKIAQCDCGTLNVQLQQHALRVQLMWENNKRMYMNTGCDGKIHGEILLDVVSMCCFYYSFEFCLGVVCRLGFTESVCVSPWQERRADTQQHQKHTTEKQIRKIFTVVWWWIGGELFFLCAQYDLQIARYHIMLANGYFLRIHRKICYQRAKHKYMLFTCDFSISSNTFSHPRELECHPISEASPRISEWKPSVKKQ